MAVLGAASSLVIAPLASGTPLTSPNSNSGPPAASVPIAQPPTELPRSGGFTQFSLGERWIVAARPGSQATAVARASGAEVVDPRLGLFVAPRGHAAQLVVDLKRKGLFSFAERDVAVAPRALPQDPLFALQWAAPLVSGDLTPPPADRGHHVAILEDAYDTTHPDLPHVTYGRGVFGKRPYLDPDQETSRGAISHGTGVTSVATAAANGVGLVGVWPGQTTRVYAPGPTCSNAALAVRRAADAGAAAINMSYGFVGGGGACFAHRRATNYAFGRGSTLIAAAGNHRLDQDDRTGTRQPWSQPANDLHVLNVGSINRRRLASGFSHQNLSLDIVAPGEQVLAAEPIDLDVFDGAPDGYAVVDGTSYAAPAVAAAAAWLSKAKPRASSAQIQRLLRASATDLGRRGYDRAYGFGLVNLKRALKSRLPVDDPAEPNDDIEWINGRQFGAPDPLRLRRRRSVVIRASVDRFKDPVDVIPIYLPRRSRLDIRLRGMRTNLNLEVFAARKAKTVFRARGRISRSVNKGKAPERIQVTNTGNLPFTVYAAVKLHPRAKLDSDYVLSLKRR